MAFGELKILGRVVGTADGWDENDLLSMQFYGFIPANGFDMPAGTLYADFDAGIFETYGDEGIVLASKDMLVVLNGLAAVQHRNS